MESSCSSSSGPSNSCKIKDGAADFPLCGVPAPALILHPDYNYNSNNSLLSPPHRLYSVNTFPLIPCSSFPCCSLLSPPPSPPLQPRLASSSSTNYTLCTPTSSPHYNWPTPPSYSSFPPPPPPPLYSLLSSPNHPSTPLFPSHHGSPLPNLPPLAHFHSPHHPTPTLEPLNSSPPTLMTKRDWLSSLTVQASSSSSSLSPPDQHAPAMAPGSLPRSSSSPTLRIDEPITVASHGQQCQGAPKCANFDAHHEILLPATSSGTGVRATALRLSAVMAALQADRDPAPHINLGVKASKERGSPIRQLHSSKLDSRQKEPRKNRKAGKSECASSKMIHKFTTTLQCQVMDQTEKAHDFEWFGRMGSKREVHIYAERERRRGMSHAYATLRSLLPKDNIKADRCTVLTEAMQHIQGLLEELDELSKQKEEVLARKECGVQVNHTDVAAKTTLERSAEEYASCAHSNYNVADRKHTQVENGDKGNDEVVFTCTRPTNAKLDGTICNGHLSKTVNEEGGVACDEDEDDRVANLMQDGDVGVRFFGEDAFITVCTLKKKGSWSSLLEVVQQFGIQIHSVTFSASPYSAHHCIHAKVPRGFHMNSKDLQQSLKNFVSEKQKSNLNMVQTIPAITLH